MILKFIVKYKYIAAILQFFACAFLLPYVIAGFENPLLRLLKETYFVVVTWLSYQIAGSPFLLQLHKLLERLKRSGSGVQWILSHSPVFSLHLLHHSRRSCSVSDVTYLLIHPNFSLYTQSSNPIIFFLWNLHHTKFILGGTAHDWKIFSQLIHFDQLSNNTVVLSRKKLLRLLPVTPIKRGLLFPARGDCFLDMRSVEI